MLVRYPCILIEYIHTRAPYKRSRTKSIQAYRGTSLVRTSNFLGPDRRPMPRLLGGSLGGGRFLAGEVPLYSRRGPNEARRRSRSPHSPAQDDQSDYRATLLIRNRYPV